MRMKKWIGTLISVLAVCAMLLPCAYASGSILDSHSPEAMAAAERAYVFQPKVCSVFMKEVFGETMCETWYHLVDAVMAGEDTFACPDQHTYDWVMGQFPRRCFPVLTDLIDYTWDWSHSVKNGVASFTSVLWDYNFEAFFPERGILRCWRHKEEWDTDYFDFRYE